MADIVIWSMNGQEHAESVSSLVTELTACIASQRPYPISRVFELLPVRSPDQHDAEQRGVLSVDNHRFENIADSPLEMLFSDPAMGEFEVVIPAHVVIEVTIADEAFIISFAGEQEPLEFTVPKVEELGLDRSKYQLLRTVNITEFSSVSTFSDKLNLDHDLEIDVSLVDAVEEISLDEPIEEREGHFSAMEFTAAFANMSDPCGLDEDQGDHYVLQRRNSGFCVVSSDPQDTRAPSVVVFQGTSQQCNRWLDQNCDPTC